MFEQQLTDFPYLDSLMGWFDQDCDLFGELPDLIKRIAYVSHDFEVWGMIADIRRFFLYHGGHADERFETIFNPQVAISSWGTTVPEWLRWVESILLDYAPELPKGLKRQDPPPTFG